MLAVAPVPKRDLEAWFESEDADAVGSERLVDMEPGNAPLADGVAPVVVAGKPLGVKGILSLAANADV
jgi:hypothetical protein